MNFKNIWLGAIIATTAVMVVVPQAQACVNETAMIQAFSWIYDKALLDTTNDTSQHCVADVPEMLNMTQKFRQTQENIDLAKKQVSEYFLNAKNPQILALSRIASEVMEPFAEIVMGNTTYEPHIENDYFAHINYDLDKKVKQLFESLGENAPSFANVMRWVILTATKDYSYPLQYPATGISVKKLVANADVVNEAIKQSYPEIDNCNVAGLKDTLEEMIILQIELNAVK